jgi:molecular chaperone DnaJ
MALNYYQLLGIPVDADQQEIRTVYRRMAKRCHPDTNQGSQAAAELFRQINEAYRILSDEKTREKYNNELNQRLKQSSTNKVKHRKSVNPQQKFNHFMNSLLDAMFGPMETPPPQQHPTPPPRQKQQGPAFNVYYHQAMDKNNSIYVRGKDGIIRKKKPVDPKHRRPTKSRFEL